MRHRKLSLLALALTSLATTSAAQDMKLERIATGLNNPLFATAPEGDERIFVVEKRGIVRIVRNGGLDTSVFFLNISSNVSTNSERGLLGMAFHPDFENNGYVFTSYTNNSGTSVVSRWSINPNNPDRLDFSSEEILLTQSQPFSNHNGGWIGFGPDGYLYIAFGDGGDANDPGCEAQDNMTFLGKMLRIDVDSGTPYAIPPDNPFVGNASYLPEIYHTGLRNPWRCSFDTATGDMWIGDVGQDAREEIDFVPAGVSGLNFGWKRLEGTRCNSAMNCGVIPGCADVSYTDPIFELSHSTSAAGSITGGYVYRGCAIPSMQGHYFFADYLDDRIRTFTYDAGTGTVNNFVDRTTELTPSVGTLVNISSFGEDGFGEILILETSNAGELYKVVPVNSTASVAATRNGGGTNATCYENEALPILGNQWRAEIDVSGHAGATIAGSVGYAGSTSGLFVAGGEALVDLGSAKVFQILLPVSGSSVDVVGAIPCDFALSGLVAYTQAVILGGGSWELCNAIDLTLGSY